MDDVCPDTRSHGTAPPARHRISLWIPIVVVVVLLSTISARWISVIRSPDYSIQRLGSAVEDRDWNGFLKYVDTEAVLGQVVELVVARSAMAEDPDFGGLSQSAKRDLVHGAKDALREGIEKGGESSRSLGTLGGYLSAKKVKSATRVGDEALVTVEVAGENRVIDVTLRMKRADNYWRVIRIENLADLPLSGDNS